MGALPTNPNLAPEVWDLIEVLYRRFESFYLPFEAEELPNPLSVPHQHLGGTWALFTGIGFPFICLQGLCKNVVVAYGSQVPRGKDI